jgi:hypothetical protein
MMPDVIFERTLEKFPSIRNLNYASDMSRLEVMSELQKAHWHFLDDLAKEFGLESVGEQAFFSSALYRIAMIGVDPFYSPSQYISEWETWTTQCMVGGAALIRFHPVASQWEVLMVKCYKPHLSELSSTWAGGKADPTDDTLWATCVREVFEEIGLDITPDRSKVVAVIENRRVFNAVIPFDYNDPRLQQLSMKAFEIQEIVWVPVSINIDEIKMPQKIHGRIEDDGIMKAKRNPNELRMPPDFQNSFRMLQDLLRQNIIANPSPNVDQVLNQDPKQWLASRKLRGSRR